jgi:GNAT superfamily N-acetyltransferase
MEAAKIKRLKQSDIPEAMELVWKVFLAFEAPGYSGEGITEFSDFIDCQTLINKMRNSQITLWGSWGGDKIVSVIATRLPCHICLLFVDPEYHRRGIARSLFHTALQHYRKDPGIAEMTVNSSPYAKEVYHRFGFCDLDTEQEVNGIRFIPMKLTF